MSKEGENEVIRIITSQVLAERALLFSRLRERMPHLKEKVVGVNVK